MSEAALDWRKSSYSGSTSNCVEVALAPSGVAVRDSKNPSAGYFIAGTPKWAAFIDAIKSGRLDLS